VVVQFLRVRLTPPPSPYVMDWPEIMDENRPKLRGKTKAFWSSQSMRVMVAKRDRQAVSIMRMRFLSMVLLVVAMLFSAWGNVVAAAFCPRYASNRNCCIKQTVSPPKQAEHPSSCHAEMAGMKMDGMPMETETSADSGTDPGMQNSPAELKSESSTDQVAFALPIEECPHCWSHSQPTSGAASVVTVEASKRLVETSLPTADFAVGSPPAFYGLVSLSRPGPPGSSLPRHVLINVFRI
jgi:hypothetical protein